MLILMRLAPKLKELTIAGVAAAYGNKTSDDYADDLEAALIRNSALQYCRV